MAREGFIVVWLVECRVNNEVLFDGFGLGNYITVVVEFFFGFFWGGVWL